ncbi:unnamed protein product [marine sediment metagenome]|uniref:Malonyl-CoA:ACP transacylase (MAT) domain-containing protein n=1 Tax=marine sediment metagenome TaxID=412755 RepID=X0Z6Y9_9ZZZZ
MLLVFSNRDTVTEIIRDLTDKEQSRVSLAAINGPSNIVVSGESYVIDKIVLQLTKLSVRNFKLNVSHGFHSILMEPILEDFKGILDTAAFHPLKIPVIPNVTGEMLKKGTLDKEYWGKHLMQTVMFEKSIHTAVKEGVTLFLEVGPDTTASGMLKAIIKDYQGISVINSLNKGKEDRIELNHAAAQVFVLGVDLDFGVLEKGKVRTEILPVCPLNKEKCWVEQYKGQKIQQALDKEQNAAKEDTLEIIGQDNPVLRDHVVRGGRIFPGAALWEAVIRKASLKYNTAVTGLKQIKHISQLALKAGRQLNISPVTLGITGIFKG